MRSCQGQALRSLRMVHSPISVARGQASGRTKKVHELPPEESRSHHYRYARCASDIFVDARLSGDFITIGVDVTFRRSLPALALSFTAFGCGRGLPRSRWRRTALSLTVFLAALSTACDREASEEDQPASTPSDGGMSSGSGGMPVTGGVSGSGGDQAIPGTGGFEAGAGGAGNSSGSSGGSGGDASGGAGGSGGSGSGGSQDPDV